MTVEKTQENLSTAVEKTEQALGGLENSLGNNEEESLLAIPENSEANDELPEGWVRATLADIAMWGSGGTPSRKNADYYGGEIPWVKTGDLGPRYVTAATEFITEEAVKNSSAKYFPKGSVALAMYGATIGKTSILGIDATTNQACAVGNPIENVTSTDYLYYFLKNEKDAFIAKGKGGAQPNISQALIKAHEISLPPLAEQTVIAQTLDTLLAQVDNIKTRLDAIPKILKTFRQSVLAAAVSGKLTEEWRGGNECETPEVSHDSKLPRLDADDLYSTTIDGWIWTRLGSVSKLINGDRGKNYPNKSEYVEKGIPFINTGHIDPNGTLSDERMNYISEEKYNSLGGGKVEPSDLVYCLRGATMGKTARVNYDIGAIASSLVIVRAGRSLNRDFTYYFLVGPESKKLIKNYDNGSAQPNLSAKSLASYPIQLPPIEEQSEIVRRVEELFAFADQIEQQVKNAQMRVNNLTQSILAKAFRGELTAQWRAENPDLITGDNSAEALLAKITEERDKLVIKKKPKTIQKKVANK